MKCVRNHCRRVPTKIFKNIIDDSKTWLKNKKNAVIQVFIGIIHISFNGRYCWSMSFASGTVCRSGWSVGPGPRHRRPRGDRDRGGGGCARRSGDGRRGGRTGLMTWCPNLSRPPPSYCRPATRLNCRNCPRNGHRRTYLECQQTGPRVKYAIIIINMLRLGLSSYTLK